MPARHEGRVARVDLPLEPVRPHPVDAELGRGPGPQGPEDGAGSDRHDLGRELHLDRLAQPLEGREVADDVVGDPQAAHGPPEQPGPYGHPRRISGVV